MGFSNAMEVLDALVHAYYDERNIEATLACVTDDIEWVGTENNDSAKGKEELNHLLQADVQAYPDSFGVELEEPLIQQLGPDAVVMTVIGEQIAEPGKVAGFVIRGTACCVKTSEGWLIANLHVSVPNAEVEKVFLQNELSMEREKQASLLQNIPGGVTTFRLKKDGHVCTDYISDGLAKLCGYSSGKEYTDAIGNNNSRFVLPGEFQVVEDACKKVAQSGGKESVNYRIYNKEGKILWLQLDFVAMTQSPLAEDDVAVFYGVQTLLSKDTLRAKREQDYYRAILNLTQTTYFELDEEGTFHYSDSFKNYKVSEYGLPAIMGNEDARKCFYPDDLETVKTYLHQVHLNGDSSSAIVRMLMTDGSYQWTELTAHAEFTEQHTVSRMTGILKKVNAEWEKQKESLNMALGEAKKANQAKTDFLSRVSHDMRTPLNGILGLTALLKDSITDSDALCDLSELEASGRYLLDLINDTLDISRIENGKMELHPEVYDGRLLFNNALRLATINAKAKNIKINVTAQDLPFTLLYVDVGRIEQIVLNVVGNAVKFTPEGGRIDITMTNVSVENGIITDRLVVADSGIGISKDFLPHIFEAFSQADTSKTSVSQGTGLGMAITKQLLQLMGGDIAVESELGKGSKFTILLKLPVATDEQRQEWNRNQHISTNGAELMNKRILLCEDHPLNAKIAIRLLEAKGVVVEHAKNGQIGVDMFQYSEAGYYDAVLMDIRMPVMDGIDAAKEIRSLPRADAQTVPIIAMTANAFAEDVEQTKKAGMDAHLSKPIQPEVLYETLVEMFDIKHQEKRRKILVVDDVEANREILRASLEDDYEIVEAVNGKQAMELIESCHDLDAVITDIQMPEMDGIELIRRIRQDKKYRHMVIIANTQFGDPEQEEKLLALGANDFVYKPTTPKIVEIRVRNALRR